MCENTGAQEQTQEQEDEQDEIGHCCLCHDEIVNPEQQCERGHVLALQRDPQGHWRESGYACDSCATCCDNCGEPMPTEYTADVRTRYSRRSDWCPTCVCDDTWTCESCGDLFECGAFEPFVYDGEYYCDSCGADHRREDDARGIIGEYHDRERRANTRPQRNLWSDRNAGRYFGVELELERKSDTPLHEIAAQLLGAANTETTLLFAEHDGSLRCGFELITQPLGLPQQIALWSKVLAHPAAAEMKSHDTETCGLHVHVSRAGLSQLTIAKAVVFLNAEATEDLVRCIARRYNTGYCHRKRAKLSRDAVQSGDRYEMLNTSGKQTVEFRIFRGSTRVQTVAACVEFAHAVLDWARDASCAEVADPKQSVQSFLRHVYRKSNAADTKHLRAYFARRVLNYSGAHGTVRAALNVAVCGMERDGIAHTAHEIAQAGEQFTTTLQEA